MENAQIRPLLKTFDLTVIVVGLVVGMGIFRTPTEVAQMAQVPWIFFVAWIVGALVTLIGALTFAEIGSRYPAAGGFYKIFSHSYHPAFAFMVNWVTLISNAAATAGVAMMGAEYIAPLLLPTWDPTVSVQAITVTAVAILYVVNMLGIRSGAKLLNGLMFIKVGMLLLLIVAMFWVGGSHATVSKPAPAQDFNPWLAFAMCFVPVFFTYGGYQQTINFGSDVPDARRTMPRAIFLGISIVMLIYLWVNFSYYTVLGFEGLQATKTIAADISGLLMGELASKVVAVVMFCSVMAYVNVSMMTNPRVYYAMAEDRVLPAIFGRVNPRTQTQEFALTLFCVFILLTLFFLASLKTILEYVMFIDSFSLITAASAIFVLRYRAKRLGEPEGIYKVKGYPYLPLLYVLVYVAVNLSVLLSNTDAVLWGSVLLLSGLPLYYVARWLVGRERPKPLE